MIAGHDQFQLSLKTRGLACGRGETVLARDIDIDLAPGTGMVLRGANGVGKSTLLLTLAALLPPLSGTVTLSGHDPDTGPARHYCGHRNGIRARLSVADTLDFWADLNGPYGATVDAALDEVGLAGAARLDAGYLSAGQQRRLALARLLVSPRPLWLLDEPTAALDQAGHQFVERLIERHLKQGGIAVIASHDEIAVPDLLTLTLGGQA